MNLGWQERADGNVTFTREGCCMAGPPPPKREGFVVFWTSCVGTHVTWTYLPVKEAS